MRCSQCGTDNPEGAKFCLSCAAPLSVVCRQCGTELPALAKFCFNCAAPVSAPPAPAPPQSAGAIGERLRRLMPKEVVERLLAAGGQLAGERRLVTILFSDVQGSTAMAESLDPEVVMEIMDGAFDVLIEPIMRYEGTLARLMGDAILAFFGAPLAHEDDPERACRAALEIVEGAKGYAGRLEAERGISGFNVRVGINTGLVAVGEVGSDLRVEYTAMGDAINLAARMEQSAPAGGILITHDTYRHVRGVFDVSPQPPLMVKGRAQPVSTYLVQRSKERAFRVSLRGFEGIETRMVGREAELVALQSRFQDVVEDRETRVVTIVGEAGVGKTRLLQELDNWCELRPELFWFFYGSAPSTAQTVPYSLWRDLLGYRFQILDSDRATVALRKFREGMAGVLEEEKADLVGQLVGFDFSQSPNVAPLLGSESFGQMARAFLVQYLRGLLAQQPVVMLLEDLQWADDSSLDLVAYVVEEIPDAALLVVAAARPEFLERRPSWGEGLEAYSRLELKPLTKRASRALVDEILQRAESVPESLRQLVVEGGEGNPFYVEELIKILIEDGVIEAGEISWRVVEERLAVVRVPTTLTGVLQARMDLLPPGERLVLQRAAVVGRDFWDSVVEELAAEDTAQEEVGELLGALRDRELVYRRERSAFAEAREYTFKHSVLRDVAYETVLLKLRRQYHGLVARWLEGHAGERLAEHLGLIAWHYELAGEGQKAAGYLARSGDEAFKIGALGDAHAAFQRALGLLPEDAMAKRAALQVKAGQVLIWLGDYAAARETLGEGVRLAQITGERATEAGALLRLGEVAWRQGDLDEASQLLREGLALAQTCEDKSGQALAAQHLARVGWLRAEYEEAVGWGEESLALYEEQGDQRGIMSARNELANIYAIQDDHEKATRYHTANLALARDIGDRWSVVSALINLGVVALYKGNPGVARPLFEEALALSEEIGDRLGVALALNNLGETCVMLGEDSAAWGYVHSGLREAVGLRDTPHAVAVLACAAHLRLHAGQPERAAELLGLALRHPASYSEIEHDARPLLQELGEVLGPDELEAALARGAALDLDEVVAGILSDT